eukprot:GHRQ01017605.1.p4 GENE.GHRQ01017605.1~~GHRQ01017605.1.p4  ORF type:complete len:104 (-),score=15.70 GHRQ01017605.1:1368-1679(-)
MLTAISVMDAYTGLETVIMSEAHVRPSATNGSASRLQRQHVHSGSRYTRQSRGAWVLTATTLRQHGFSRCACIAGRTVMLVTYTVTCTRGRHGCLPAPRQAGK